MDSPNSVSLLMAGYPRRISVAVPDLSVSAENGSVTLVNVASDYEVVTIEIVDTDPADFVGSYTIAVSDLDDGIELLAAPIVPGTATLGGTLPGSLALWVYDPDAYAAAGKTFSPSRQWYRDGVPIDGETGFSTMVTAPGAYTLTESVEAPNGEIVTATSLVSTAGAGVALASVPLAGRTIDMAGILNDSRKIAVVAYFEAIRRSTATQALIGTHAAEVNDYNQALMLSVRQDGELTARATYEGGSAPSVRSWTDTFLDVPEPGFVVFVADLDQAGDATRISARAQSLRAGSVIDRAETRAPADRVFALNAELDFAGRSLDPALRDPMHADTRLLFLWVATAWTNPSDNSLTTLRNGIVDAFFSVDGTGPYTISPASLALDGVITVGGNAIRPDIFLAGAQLGQYDDADTTRLTNRGAGADPILVGTNFP